ncbi:syncoilin-like [Cololabis saira]|uniref:syncoilin-like n=1 Tax=Cololabis saira TaxID=129043 RepID=UPI002AD213B1|nr:syncoilin-like [Cololabis saira]XP_061597920.1 syncoilin-like [Cololabis saira]
MNDLDDDISSAEVMPLFIAEEEGDPDRAPAEQSEGNKNPPRLTGTKPNQSASIKPYLHEMDELLKSCEELTGIPFSSRYSPGHTETRESCHGEGREEVTMHSFEAQAYLSTNYLDTDIDRDGTKEKSALAQSSGSILNRDSVTTRAPSQADMPLTSAGSKLSESMVEYESQLLGMLSMLENCMEEAGMDFEPKGWGADGGQEYVHISKNPQHYRGTTLVPIKQEKPGEQETHPMEVEYCVAGDKASKGSMSRVTEGLAANGNQHNPRCEKMGGISAESDFKSDQSISYKKFKFSGLQMLVDNTEQDPIYCEGTKTEHMFYKGTETMGDVTDSDVEDAEQPTEEKDQFKLGNIDQGSNTDSFRALGSQMETYIEEVRQLQKRRKELLTDVLQLRGHKAKDEAGGRSEEEEETEEWVDCKVVELFQVLKREEEARREERRCEIHNLRERRAEEERKLWSVNLEAQGLQEELRKLKMRLFAMVRDCAHNQAVLTNQHREVESRKREEERLSSLLLQLTEEGRQLKSAQQQQLSDMRAKLHAQRSSQTSNTQDELTECRRHSCGDIQQYLQGGLKALEERYEPILLALLKRREAAAGALVKAKEQARELRAKLGPLRGEIQELKLQRACLEEKLKLKHIQRMEGVGHYKESVYCLEERSRDMKTELEIQKRKNKEMEELRDRLTTLVLLHR